MAMAVPVSMSPAVPMVPALREDTHAHDEVEEEPQKGEQRDQV